MTSFNSAFASARKAGKKTFSWNGKSYNTKLATGNGTPSKAPVPTPRPKEGKFAGVSSDDFPTPKKTPGPTPIPKKKMPALSAKDAGSPMSTMKKITNSIRIGKTAVERGRRRDAAMSHNKR